MDNRGFGANTAGKTPRRVKTWPTPDRFFARRGDQNGDSARAFLSIIRGRPRAEDPVFVGDADFRPLGADFCSSPEVKGRSIYDAAREVSEAKRAGGKKKKRTINDSGRDGAAWALS